ncbi:MAG: cytochrome c peroxidase [Bacteroidota bacterium]
MKILNRHARIYLVDQLISLLGLIGIFWCMSLTCGCSSDVEAPESQVEGDDAAFEARTDLENLNLPINPFNYAELDLPSHFFATDVVMADNTPASNPVTNVGATLGRVLFYDKNLSLNRTIACSSCHTQSSGFTDNSALSRGFEGQLTGRNSMNLANAKYYRTGHFFWDERAATLEEQVLMPIQDQVEMGMDLDSLEQRLQEVSYYPTLFAETFGDSAITSEGISFALAQFVRSMVSYQSPYDVALAQNGGNANTDFQTFSVLENTGKNLFFGRGACDRCHSTALFIADRAFNNGLDVSLGLDDGLGAVSGITAEQGLFKVPSLRNVALGPPFMHDGRFESLEEVVRHYNNGVQDHPNLSQEMLGRNGEVRRLNLSENDIDALVAFMETFTDEAFIEDEKFSDPFVD